MAPPTSFISTTPTVLAPPKSSPLEGRVPPRPYTYDEDNRLIAVSLNASTNTHSFSYDYRSTPTTPHMVVVFDGGLSIQEYSGVGGMVYSIKPPEAGRENDDIICSHANHRSDIIARSNSAGSLISFALYEAYGTRPYEWGDGITGDPDRQKANTKEEETDLGLLFEGMRPRDLETGVWLTADPAGYVDGPNLYCYVNCNPITKFDAFGLWKKDVHYDDTKSWAESKGFTPKQAKIIAKACNGVDSPFKRKGPIPLIGDQSYHFDTSKAGEQDSRRTNAKKHFDKAVKLALHGSAS